MTKYIKLEDVEKRIEKHVRNLYGTMVIDDARAILADLPTIEVSEDCISRPRGEWIDHEDYHSCSVCGIDWTFIDDSGGSNYCPNCGAEMKGDEE